MAKLTSGQIWDTVTGETVAQLLDVHAQDFAERAEALAYAHHDTIQPVALEHPEAWRQTLDIGTLAGRADYCRWLAKIVRMGLAEHVGQGGS
jgi:hypothetical protein